MAYRNYAPANGFIVDKLGNGDFTTIQAAITAATAGDTIYIMPSSTSYSENLTLKAGVSLTAFGSDSSLNQTGNVIISGTCTFTAAGTVSIYGIQLQTNGAAFLAVTGSDASAVNLQNCYLACTNATGITHSSSSASSSLLIRNCTGNIGTTGISLFTKTSASSINFFECTFTNSGNTTTASTVSSGSVGMWNCIIDFPLSTSSIGGFGLTGTTIRTNSTNTTCLTTAGTNSSSLTGCDLNSGIPAAISIGAGTTVIAHECHIISIATNVITGAGTLSYDMLSFYYLASINAIDVTTQTGGIGVGNKTRAPSAGFIGEQITNSATAVAMVNTIAKTITSISLTAGVWDVSGICFSISASGVITAQIVGISATNNTITGTAGIDFWQINPGGAGIAFTGVVPQYRIVLTTTTTYYLVANVFFTIGATSNGRLTATRVG